MADTFHVWVRVRATSHRIVLMATSPEDARRRAEAEGHDVVKVRRAPTTPVDNLARHGRRR